jgi:hypothetical protein
MKQKSTPSFACDSTTRPEYDQHKLIEWNGETYIIRLVISLNLRRRHLSESQRAMVATRLANTQQGRRTDQQLPANLPEVSQQAAAPSLSVSERLARHAKSVQTAGVPELAKAVDSSEIHVAKRRVTHYGVARFGEMGCEAVVLDDGSRGYLRRQMAQLIGLHSKNPSSRFAQICVDFAPKSLSLLDKSESPILMPHGGNGRFFTVRTVLTSVG